MAYRHRIASFFCNSRPNKVGRSGTEHATALSPPNDRDPTTRHISFLTAGFRPFLVLTYSYAALLCFDDLFVVAAEQRGGYGEERYEKRDMQLRVRQRFDQLQRLDEKEASSFSMNNQSDCDGARGSIIRVPAWYVIDASQSIEQVHSQVWDAVENTLSALSPTSSSSHGHGCVDAPLGKLWEKGVYDPPAEGGL